MSPIPETLPIVTGCEYDDHSTMECEIGRRIGAVGAVLRSLYCTAVTKRHNEYQTTGSGSKDVSGSSIVRYFSISSCKYHT